MNCGFRSKSKRSAYKLSRELLKKPHIQTRILELRGEIASKVTEKVADGLTATFERTIDELARIAFADIRQAVEWRGNFTRVTEQANPDEHAEGPVDVVIKEVVNNAVRLIDSDQLPAEIASAIAEVKQTSDGVVGIKFHDKLRALSILAQHFGITKGTGQQTRGDEQVGEPPAAAPTEPPKDAAILRIEQFLSGKNGKNGH